MVPLLDGPTEGGHSEQHLQEQEKRIEISCALAAEASRRSRLLSGELASRCEPLRQRSGDQPMSQAPHLAVPPQGPPCTRGFYHPPGIKSDP